MPLLARLFARKSKPPPPPDSLDDHFSNSPTYAYTAESNESSQSSYVNVAPVPIAQDLHQPPIATGGGGGLRLFRRKKSSSPGTVPNTNNRPEFNSPQRPLLPRPDSGPDLTELRRLRPPPSRSAIFAAYADSGSSLSTRSLPENSFRPSSPLLSPTPSTAPPQKRPSLFAWARPASRSSSNTGSNLDVSLGAPSESSELSPDLQSFNLKSFRHVGSATPTLHNPRPVSMSPPIPHPRGSTLHSDSSQRISVAAFREVHTRRSQTGSPVQSPLESSSLLASDTSGPRPGHRPRPSRSSTAVLQTSRQSQSSIAVASTTDEEDSSSEVDSDCESVYKAKSTHRPGRKAQSELGHGSIPTESSFKRTGELVRAPRASRSHIGHGSSSNHRPRPLTEFERVKVPELPRRSQSTLGLYETPNKLSTTASMTSLNKGHTQNPSNSSNVSHSTARKVTPPQTAPSRKSTIGKASVGPPPRNSDSDSEDNAPLAALIPPKRPGSATSSYSNPRSISGLTNRSAGHAKPLIDVNEVISSKPTSVSSPPSDVAFTQGPTLLSAVKTTIVMRGSSPLVPNPKSVDDDEQSLAKRVLPAKLVSLPQSPAKEMEMRELARPNLDESVDLEASTSASIPQQKETTLEQQRRDPLSDRLTRVVKKSLTNPADSGPMPAPINKLFEGATNRLSVATSSESLHARQSYEAARISLPRSPPPILHPSKDEYGPPDEDLAKLLGSVGIKLISRTGDSDETSSSESSEDDDDDEKDDDRIAPIPIKERTTPPAFAVTSRPAFPKLQNSNSSPTEVKDLTAQSGRKTQATTRPSDYPGIRQRSSSMIPSSSASSFPSTTASPSTRNSKFTSYFTSPSATDVSTKGTSSDSHTRVSSIGVDKTTGVRPALVKPKSSTMITGVPLSSQMPRHFNPPDRRFATVRGNSPSSSTGDSSSGRAPHTPRDSGEMCVPEDRDQKRLSTMKAEEWNRGSSGLGIKRQNAHTKRRSVSFEDDVRDLNNKPSRSHIREAATAGSDTVRSGGSHARESVRASPDRDSSDEEEKEKEKERGKEKEKEEKRKERRRQETQAAIELGNVMHGPPPVLDDDNNDMPTNPTMNRRMSGFNPMMVMNTMNMPMTFNPPPGPGGWVPSMGQPMVSPGQYMIPQPSNPSMMAAHQQAMMFAKQAYQMAVAQQAMAAAAEEWERGSALSGFGSGGSVYGSTAPSMMNASPGMMGGMNMMPGMQGNLTGGMWPGYGGMGAVPRFGNFLSPGDMQFNSSRSDHGGPGAGTRTSGNWSSSKSMYGESQQPNQSSLRRIALQQQSVRPQTWNGGRDSMQFPPVPPVPPIPASKNMTGKGSPEPRGPSRLRTSSQPTTPTRSAFARKAIPPSSWRPAGS